MRLFYGSLLALLASCASPAQRARAHAFEIAREGDLPELAVHSLLYRKSSEGTILEAQPIGIVFTRPLDPAPFHVVDQFGVEIAGRTAWIDRQLALFRPQADWPRGRLLKLSSTVSLRAADGGALATVPTRPFHVASARVWNGSDFHPLSTIALRFENDVTAAEIEAHGLLHVATQKTPIPFRVELENHTSPERPALLITPLRAMRPGLMLVFSWKDGPILPTATGTTSLEPRVEFEVHAGLGVLHIGEGHACSAGSKGVGSRMIHCRQSGESVEIALSAPITAAEAAAHVHVGKGGTVALIDPVEGASGRIAVTGFATSGPGTYLRVTLEPALTDVFGSTLGTRDILVIERSSP